MTTTFHWLVKDKVIYSRFSGQISIEEIEGVVQESINIINSTPPDIPLIHAIVDNRQVTRFPQNVPKITSIFKQLMQHPRLGWIIYVSDMNPILKMMSSIVAQVARTRYRSFSDEVSALEFLQYVDTTLPDLSAIDLSNLQLLRDFTNHDVEDGKIKE